jgi:intracellular sulfur oxidation DsrE/DsrF family protein
MISKLIWALLLSFTTLFAVEQKAVFDLTSGDETKIEKHLVNTIEGLGKYYKSNGIDFNVAVVISGDAYKYFVQDIEHSPYKGDKTLLSAQKRLGPMFEKLQAQYGVEFDMCRAGRRARGIEKGLLYPYVKSSLNKSVYLIRWQNMGYAYMPVH